MTVVAVEESLATHGAFGDEWIVLTRIGGPRLPGTSAAGIARQVRRALLRAGESPLGEALCGHKPTGEPADSPHLAVVPLPDIGDPTSTGELVGVALVLPATATRSERARLSEALEALERLYKRRHVTNVRPAIEIFLDATGTLVLTRAPQLESHRLLRSETWCASSTRWATVTPIALDRNPGDLRHSDPERRARAMEEAAASVAESVTRLGLPRPTVVDILRESDAPGAVPAWEYPRFPINRDRHPRVLVHAWLRFDAPIMGPLLIGAGRYSGLGLCAPM